MNNDGVPSVEEATLHFFKTPYYYQTLWFRIVMMFGGAISVAFIAGSIYRYRIEKLNRKLQRQKIQIELERKATEAERLAKEQEIKLSKSL